MPSKNKFDSPGDQVLRSERDINSAARSLLLNDLPRKNGCFLQTNQFYQNKVQQSKQCRKIVGFPNYDSSSLLTTGGKDG